MKILKDDIIYNKETFEPILEITLQFPLQLIIDSTIKENMIANRMGDDLIEEINRYFHEKAK